VNSSPSARDPEDEIWRQCERAWAAWLEEQNWDVDLVPPYREDGSDGAPLEFLRDGRQVRRPDIRAAKGDTVEWWEVKYRTRADVNLLDGQREFWIEKDAFDDYRDLHRDRSVRIFVILRLEADHLQEARWLQITVPTLARQGRRAKKTLVNGDVVDAWIWPESAMTIVPGPLLPVDRTTISHFNHEDGVEPISDSELQIAELEARRPTALSASADSRAATLIADPMLALDVLRRRSDIAVPELPRYSVLRIAPTGEDVEPLLGLLDYGIRVFLVTRDRPPGELSEKYLHFIGSRLLEWSYADIDGLEGFWAVDGIADGLRFPDWPANVRAALDRADDNGGINVGQYEVVHSDPDRDIVISAGAGTGKTETMAERILYLLSTSALIEERGIEQYPYDLRLDDIVLVTFTREAAAQMRERLARVLNLRRRLSPRCVLAAVPWLTQLATTQITTIHQYARHVTQQSATAIGFDPNLAVSSQTLELRRIMHQALSPHLIKLLGEFPNNGGSEDPKIPAAYEWIEHLERIWEALTNNGIQVMPIGQDEPDQVDWGVDDADAGVDKRFAETARDVILETGRNFAAHCLKEGLLPVDQLVPSAYQGLLASSEPRIGVPRFFFVDEFQDTDGKQMDLVLELSSRLDSRLFVVGDVKQGIYRFRGAEGSAFSLLEYRMAAQRRPAALNLGLVRNFRTGGVLLGSLHECFEEWGKAPVGKGATSPHLEYSASSALKAQVERQREGTRFTTKEVDANEYLDHVVADVRQLLADIQRRWEAAPEKKENVGILCRQNWTANEVRDRLRNEGLPCDVLIGGTFFQSEAVVEARALLDAIASPDDTGAVLELCETRWLGGIASKQTNPGGLDADEDLWNQALPQLQSWSDRLTGFDDDAVRDLHTADLEPLRGRLRSLNKLLHVMNPAALLAHCYQKFEPQSWSREPAVTDDTRDRERYQINLEHLIVLMDAAVAERPTTLLSALEWVRLQIATNEKEDEPQHGETGVVTALTVHKAKGQEFTHVLIPRTWDAFESRQATSLVSVVRDDNSPNARLLWEWKATGSSTLQNFDPSSSSKMHESEEQRKEETRLLYVAMTRARDSLAIYTKSKRGADTWGGLLEIAGR